MQFELLSLLKCPITKSDLEFQLISQFDKFYEEGQISEVKEGLLFSRLGFVFPIIDGIPRMLLESFYDYSDFLKKHLHNYEEVRSCILQNYPGLLSYCNKKNKRTKESFAFEWSFLKAEKRDKVWHDDISKLSEVFLSEMGEVPSFFNEKLVIDVGSGHGLMTAQIAKFCKIAVGVELSKAVEGAYANNKTKNAWFVQADLQFLPFGESSFEILYSSGVIHHTNNTELSLSLIERTIKSNGKVCLWLYHPRKSFLHKIMLDVRKITSKLPLQLLYIFLVLFVLPFTLLIKNIKNKNAPNWREEIIDLLDHFSPEFRFEIEPDVAMIWLQRRNFVNTKVTTKNLFGFSIASNKL